MGARRILSFISYFRLASYWRVIEENSFAEAKLPLALAP